MYYSLRVFLSYLSLKGSACHFSDFLIRWLDYVVIFYFKTVTFANHFSLEFYKDSVEFATLAKFNLLNNFREVNFPIKVLWGHT